MPAYEYQALDAKGRAVKGILDGDAERQIRSQLRDKGLIPLKVDEIKGEASAAANAGTRFQFQWRRGMSGAELAMTTRQFATLIRAGLTLEECLNALVEQSESATTRAVLGGVRSRVLEGTSLARALGNFPKTFPDIYRALVDAGEQSGKLSEVLERLADYTENRQALQQKVSLAFIYPALVALVAVSVIVLLMVKVVPQVTKVFANTGQVLPMPTRVLMATSEVVRATGIYIFIGLVGGLIAFNLSLRQEDFRRRWHGFLLRIPLVSKLVRGVNAARFTSTLGILTGSGIPLLQALQYAVQVVNNLPMRAAVEEALRAVREGGSLSRSLGKTKMFPPLVVHLIASGEASGKLDQLLLRAAEAQSRELENWVKALTALLEPVMILVMGVIVLFIVVAILLPIFEMNTLIR
jgi:general secretion pathway protein F